jgi:hypothetical protein
MYEYNYPPLKSVKKVTKLPALTVVWGEGWLSAAECCGAGIRRLFDPWIRIRDGKKSRANSRYIGWVGYRTVLIRVADPHSFDPYPAF